MTYTPAGHDAAGGDDHEADGQCDAHATATPLTLGGTASDNVGVTQVTWANDRGGSGTATGTTSWSVSGIVLASGANVLTVTARDAAGNTSTDTLTVTYTPARPAGLVAAYAFNETSGTDGCGCLGQCQHRARLPNGPVWAARAGTAAALQFDGANDMVCRRRSSSSLDLTTGMTLEAWVYPTVDQSSGATILTEGDRTSYIFNGCMRATGRGVPEIGRARGWQLTAPLEAPRRCRSTRGRTWRRTYDGHDPAAVRQWGTGGEHCGSGAISTSTGPLWIGGNPMWGEHFQGSIDDVRVYNRALSAAEIQADMNTPVGGAPPPLDTNAPVVTITTPTNARRTASAATPLAIGGHGHGRRRR